MLTCAKCLPRGGRLSPALLRRASEVALDWDVRQKSRFEATDSLGRSLGVFLPRGTVVRGGDVLVAEDGSLIRVEAAPQAVLRITVYVQCTEDFTQHSEVADAASDLLCEVLGDAGAHARTSVGVYQLPKNATVELDMVARATDGATA